MSLDISPKPSDEETAAILAAVEALWPKPMAVELPDTDRGVAWRFSGRWWQRDRFGAAVRPWN